MGKKFRYLLLKLLYPVLYTVGKIHMPYSRKQMSGEDYYAVKKLLKPGHVIITITYGEATNAIIPGEWSHGAIYIGAINGTPMICEAVGQGVIIRPLVDFLLSKDEVRVLEPTFATSEQMLLASIEAAKQIGAPYDYGFKFSIEPQKIKDYDSSKTKPSSRAFYCIELLIWSYLKVVPKMPFVLRKRFGEPEVTPDDLSLAQTHWDSIWDKKINGTTWG